MDQRIIQRLSVQCKKQSDASFVVMSLIDNAAASEYVRAVENERGIM